VENKKEKLDALLDILGISYENVAAIGDDLNDLSMLKSVEIAFVPADASRYVEAKADVILAKKGGDGAVREMVEYLIKREGLEKRFLELWD